MFPIKVLHRAVLVHSKIVSGIELKCGVLEMNTDYPRYSHKGFSEIKMIWRDSQNYSDLGQKKSSPKFLQLDSFTHTIFKGLEKSKRIK